MSKKNKPYFPNNWDAYNETPDDFFLSIDVDEFFDWKVGGWELPSSVNCIIREHNKVTGKVREYTYTRAGDAKNKCRAIMDIGESEFTVCTADAIHLMRPEPNYDPFEDPLA
tara:strand:- start:1614 stop:1949 length:336 start_codon:yes stop_codon:yes gene_type:complete